MYKITENDNETYNLVHTDGVNVRVVATDESLNVAVAAMEALNSLNSRN